MTTSTTKPSYTKRMLPELFWTPQNKITPAMCMELFEIGPIEIAEKNQREYRKLTFRDLSVPGVVSNGKKYFRNIWNELKDETGKILFQADSIWSVPLKKGDKIAIGHVTYETTPYLIAGNDKPNEKITVMAFANEDPLTEANRQMRRNHENGYVISFEGEMCPLPSWAEEMSGEDELNATDVKPIVNETVAETEETPEAGK